MTLRTFNKNFWFRLTKISLEKHCPNCGSRKIRRSHRHRWVENILHSFRISPFRCTDFRCQRRFLKLSSWF